MDIYKNRARIGAVEDRVKRPGHLRTKLTGINIVQASERVELEGVYRSTIAVSNHGGVITIDVALTKKTFSVYLYGRFPFISISREVPETFEEAE